MYISKVPDTASYPHDREHAGAVCCFASVEDIKNRPLKGPGACFLAFSWSVNEAGLDQSTQAGLQMQQAATTSKRSHEEAEDGGSNRSSSGHTLYSVLLSRIVQPYSVLAFQMQWLSAPSRIGCGVRVLCSSPLLCGSRKTAASSRNSQVNMMLQKPGHSRSRCLMQYARRFWSLAEMIYDEGTELAE